MLKDQKIPQKQLNIVYILNMNFIDGQEVYRQLQKQAQNAHRCLQGLEHATEWEKNGTQPCLKYKMNAGGKIASKGVSVIDYNIQRVIDFLYEEASLAKLIPELKEIKRLYQKGSLRVNYQLYHTPWPIAPRQFIILAAKIREGPYKVYISCKSCNYPYSSSKENVRGELVVGGYIMEEIDPNSTRVTYISKSDFKGSVPQIIQNKASADQAEVAAKIYAIMKDSGF